MSRDLADQVNQFQREQYLSLIQATLESTADGILVVTHDRNAPIYNQKFLQLWGISEELMQPGKADERLEYLASRTTDPQGFLDRVWELFRDRPDAEVLDIVEFNDGRTIERYSQPQRIGDQIVGRIWSFRDITNRRHAEEALRQSEARNRAIVSAIPDLMFLYNADGYFVDFVRANRDVDFLDGTVDREGKHLTDFLPKEVAARQLNAIRETLATGTVQVYEQELLVQGEWHCEEVRISPYSDDTVLLMVRDISERKRGEAERKQLEAALAERALLSAFRADVSSALAQSESLSLILTRCTKAIVKHLNAAFARIWILNSNDNLLELHASAGLYTHLDGTHRRIPVGSLKIGKIAQDRQPLLTNDVLNDSRISNPGWAKREGMVGFAGYPLMLGNQLLGVIAMFARQPISHSTFEALGFAANEIASGIRRKQAEEELHQSQQLLNTVVDNLPIALFAKDICNDFRYVLMNKSSEKMLGFSKDRAIGYNDHELIELDQAEYYRRQDLAAIAQRSLLEFVEYMVFPKTSAGIYIRGFKVPLFDSQGQATHLVCIGEDVTEQRHAEAAQQRRAMEDNLLSCISRQFIDHDVNTAILFTLEAIARFIGSDRSVIFEYSEQQRQFSVVDQWCIDDITLLPNLSSTSEDLPWFYQPILNGEVVQVANVADLPPEAVSEKALLQQLNIQSFVAVPMIYVGKVVGFLGADVVRSPRTWSQDDINLLRRVGELIAIGQARYKAEETFSKAFRSSPSPIAILTLSDNHFVEVNTSFLRLCGCTAAELIGHNMDDLNLGIAQEQYQSALQQALETGSLYNQEFEFRTQSGSFKTVLLSIELIDLGGTQCTLNIVNDITERKRLENELISLVSHELRTPMTSLLGALDLLGSGQLGTLTPQGQQVLCIATNNTERLTRLVNDILDLERMRSGKIVMQKITCNAADLMIQATEAMQTMAENAHITLITEPIQVELQADGDRILQTLTNLLSNAIKFSEAGSTVWLRAELQIADCKLQIDPSIDQSKISNLQSSIPTPHILFIVKDQGRGIPEDKLQLIFDRFQQVDASDSRKKGGTGLGLAICRNIVEQHNGKIWAESTLGRGSMFNVLLPLEN